MKEPQASTERIVANPTAGVAGAADARGASADSSREEEDRGQPSFRLGGDRAPADNTAFWGAGSFRSLPSDYRFLEYLGRSPFAEVGIGQDAAGQTQLVHRIASSGNLHLWAHNDLSFVERLKAARHAALVGMLWAKKARGTLLLFTEGADRTLWERCQQCRSEGLAGIPREELIGYLRAAAEALDYLEKKHAIRHLGLNPWSLWLRQNRLVVADAGLVQFLLLPAGKPLPHPLTRYADPELLKGNYHRASDQYSLAGIYLEMLTGDFSPPVDLDHVPVADKKALARALDADPEKRFPSCCAFLKALSTKADQGQDRERGVSDDSQELKLPPLATGHVRRPTPEQLVADLVQRAKVDASLKENSGIRYAFLKDGSAQHKCAAWLTPDVARQKLSGFFQHWRPDAIQADADSYRMRFPQQGTLWQRLTFRQPAIEVTIHLAGQQQPFAKLTEVTVRLAYRGGKPSDTRPVLLQFCPKLLQSLRQYLLAPPEQRVHERFPFEHPLAVAPRYVSSRTGKSIRGLSRDISVSGIGLVLPHKPPTDDIFIQWNIRLTTKEIVTVSVPARAERVEETTGGQHFVGARFQLDRLQSAKADHW